MSKEVSLKSWYPHLFLLSLLNLIISPKVRAKAKNILPKTIESL